jgi:hypothetical protein
VEQNRCANIGVISALPFETSIDMPASAAIAASGGRANRYLPGKRFAKRTDQNYSGSWQSVQRSKSVSSTSLNQKDNGHAIHDKTDHADESNKAGLCVCSRSRAFTLAYNFLA